MATLGCSISGGKVLLRQYCEDYAGNVYLFVLDRRRRALDIAVPRAETPVCCFGRAVMDVPAPLPGYEKI